MERGGMRQKQRTTDMLSVNAIARHKGGLAMKVRKLCSVMVLALLCAIPLAATVQAGQATPPFTIQIKDVVVQRPMYVAAGPMGHYVFVIRGTVVSGDPSLDGAQWTWIGRGPEVAPNAHPTILGPSRGPAPATWRIVMPGDPLSWWEGTSNLDSWTDPTQWPETLVLQGRGNGFGAYQNMRIRWSASLRPGAQSAVFSCEISTNE